jgi:antitoxin HigA-1
MLTSSKPTRDDKGSYPAVRNPNRRPVHPGAILRDILERENKSEIARRLHISRPTLHAILGERQPLTADMALRFAALVGTEADALLRLQANFDVWQARQRRRSPKIAPLHEARC